MLKVWSGGCFILDKLLRVERIKIWFLLLHSYFNCSLGSRVKFLPYYVRGCSIPVDILSDKLAEKVFSHKNL